MTDSHPIHQDVAAMATSDLQAFPRQLGARWREAGTLERGGIARQMDVVEAELDRRPQPLRDRTPSAQDDIAW
jgi:hypothetical protein